MGASSRMNRLGKAPVNSFLLCAVLAKQTRRMGRLLPDRRIPELIMLALKSCADYQIALDLPLGVPEVVRAGAMQIGRLMRRPEAQPAAGPGQMVGSQPADAASAVPGTRESEPAGEGSIPDATGTGPHISEGSCVDSLQPNLLRVQSKNSRSGADGIDPIRLRQLRAIAENLCMLANRHRENQDYVVAHALYGRSLSVAQEIYTPENDGSALVDRIRKDQQAVFEVMRSGQNPEKPPLKKAKEVGR